MPGTDRQTLPLLRALLTLPVCTTGKEGEDAQREGYNHRSYVTPCPTPPAARQDGVKTCLSWSTEPGSAYRPLRPARKEDVYGNDSKRG